MEFIDLSKLVGSSSFESSHASTSFFMPEEVDETHEEETKKEVNFEEIEEEKEQPVVVPVKVKKEPPPEDASSYLIVPKKDEVSEHMAEAQKRRVELRKKLFRKLEEVTIIDTTLTSVSMRSIQGTVMFFAIFLTIAMKFGEIKYLAPIFILSFILFYLVHHYVLKEVIYLRNDFNAGWNFSLKLGGDIICQILLLVAAAFTYEIIKQNPSIHAKDAFTALLKNMLQWTAIVIFLLKRMHYIILREHVVTFLLQENEAPMLLCPPSEPMALD